MNSELKNYWPPAAVKLIEELENQNKHLLDILTLIDSQEPDLTYMTICDYVCGKIPTIDEVKILNSYLEAKMRKTKYLKELS